MLHPLSPATAEWTEFKAALMAANLPTSDLDGGDQHFFALTDSLAFGGFFIAGPDALLRSIIVPVRARRGGLGRTMVMALLRQLADRGAEQVWLLTTEAGPFFERMGFEPVDRRTAPAGISATPQFQGVCPSSALLMSRAVAAATLRQETPA